MKQTSRIYAASPNNADNVTIADVIGNKEDTYNDDGEWTIMNYQNMGYQHIHSQARVYPTLADSVTVTAGSGGAWDVGTITEIIPANTITSAFDLHWAIIDNISAVDDYELILYSGPSNTEIARIVFVRDSFFAQQGNQPIQVPVQLPNSKISAALACGDGDGATCGLKLYYHTYD
jgi:hypothetical protein